VIWAYDRHVDQRPRTRLEQLVQGSKRTIEEHCRDFFTVAQRVDEPAATLSYRQLSRWMRGEVAEARAASMRVAELVWGEPWEVLVGPPSKTTRAVSMPLEASTTACGIEELRQAVHESISTRCITHTELDDWDLIVARHGRATRYVPAPTMQAELATDLQTLLAATTGTQTASSLRRTTRLIAQLAGLMFLTSIKLNQQSSARHWARTARVGANEADEPAVRSWVAAQEAYVYYYAGDLAEAVEVAQAAQALAVRSTCAGVPLAAALEARALGALGRRDDALAAIERAERSLAGLAPDETTRSAFGYDEAQLRFHAGNALTHLCETEAAMASQQRALELYPANDYLDRALVELDQAACVAVSDPDAALDDATGVLLRLRPDERDGMVLERARRLADDLPPVQRQAPEVGPYRELLASLTPPPPGPA
jgi:tetratricopeptide (TPR) repeat protein